ncbi:MAG: hypothetical protein R6V77_08530 [Candidatus Cloacimonadaceae bacterium]
MKAFLIYVILMIPFLLLGQVGISFSFANEQVSPGGSYGYYEFDILAASSATSDVLGIQVYFDYSSTRFGSNIYPNHIDVTTPLPNGYFLTVNNTFANTLSLAVNLLYGSYFVLNSNPQVIYHVRILIADPTATSVISFNQTLMAGQQFYNLPPGFNPTTYNPINYGDALGEIPPVENITITKDEMTQRVLLSWSYDITNVQFHIYQSESPYGTFTLLNTVTETQAYIYAPSDLDKRFFYVTAELLP